MNASKVAELAQACTRVKSGQSDTLGADYMADILELIAAYRAHLEVFEDHDRLVRELDAALNGEANAAKQASLCDILAQVKRLPPRHHFY